MNTDFEPFRRRAKFCRQVIAGLALSIFFSLSAPGLVSAEKDLAKVGNRAEVELGQALGLIEIPDISVDLVFVAGVGKQELKLGPGHYPGTPLPGQFGNAAIAGHRTTYGAPFSDLDLLEAGDEIVVTYPSATYVYLVTSTSIVTPDDVSVIATKDSSKGSLTLTTCHPKGSAAQRLIISAELDPKQSSPLGPATYYNGSSVSNDSTAPVLQATPAASSASSSSSTQVSTTSSTQVSTPNGSTTQSAQSPTPAAQETRPNNQVVSGVSTPSSAGSGVQLFVHSDEAPRAESVEIAQPEQTSVESSPSSSVSVVSTTETDEVADAPISVVSLDASLPSGVFAVMWLLAIGLSVSFGVMLQQRFTRPVLASAFAALPIMYAVRGFTQVVEATL